MTGVYERWCSSTLHIGWGLCDRLCPVLVCRGRYGLGGGFFSSFWDRVWAEQDRKGVFGGEEEGGGVRSGPGAARTILLFHTNDDDDLLLFFQKQNLEISARPPKQPRMAFLKVHTRPRLAYALRCRGY